MISCVLEQSARIAVSSAKTGTTHTAKNKFIEIKFERSGMSGSTIIENLEK